MSFLASTASDTLKIWQFAGSEGFRLITSSEYPREHLSSLSWNHTNQVVATAGVGRRVYLVNVSSGQMMSSLPTENELLVGDIKSLSFSSNSRCLAAGAGQEVYVWDMKTRQLTSTLQGHRGLVSTVKFFPDGRLASGDINGALRIWNVKDQISTTDLVPTASVSAMTCLEISPNSLTRIACGYEDGGLCIWDPATNILQRHQILHSGTMSSVAFSPKNPKLLATGGHDGRINLVDVGSKNTGDPSASIDVGERISVLSFHEDSIYSAVGSTVGNILLYDWRSVRKPVTRIPAHKPSCITSMSFQSVATKTASSPTKTKSAATSVSSVTSASSVDISMVKRRSGQSPIPPNPSPESPVPVAKAPSDSQLSKRPASVRTASVSALDSDDSKLVLEGGRPSVTRPSATGSTSAAVPSPPPVTSAATDRHYSLSEPTSASQSQERRPTNGTGDNYPTKSGSIGYSNVPIIESAEHVAEDIRRAIHPVTRQELREELESLRYDIHREIQGIIKEQVRQFTIAKEDTSKAIERMSAQLTELLEANRELRVENERLRRIY